MNQRPDEQNQPEPRPQGAGGDDGQKFDRLRTEVQALRSEVGELAKARQAGGKNRLEHLHLLQIQLVRDLLVILLVVGLIYLGYVLRPLTVPLLLALGLAYLFEPLVRRVTARGWIGRPLAAISIIFAIVLIVAVPVGLGVTYGTIQGIHYGTQITRNVNIVHQSIAKPEDLELQARVRDLGEGWMKIRNWLAGDPPEGAVVEQEPGAEAAQPDAPGARDPPHDDAQEIAQQAELDTRRYAAQMFAWFNQWVQTTAASLDAEFGRQAIGTGMDVLRVIWRAVSRSAYLIFAAFLVLFFFFFFSVSYPRVLRSLSELIPYWKRPQTVEMVRKMDGVVSGFVRGRLIIMCIQIVMFTIGYWLVGVPAPLVVGPIIGILALVPYLSLVGIPITIVLMWLQPVPNPWWEFMHAWWWVIAAPTMVYFIVQLSDDYIWTPTIQGKATDMDVPSILFAVLAGGILAGFYGVLLAIPAAACIKILLKDAFWPRFKAWSQGQAQDFLPLTPHDAGADRRD